MFSVVEQYISWMLIAACLLQIQADEPRCYYMDLEMRLSEKLTLLQSQNKEILYRLANIESHHGRKKGSTSPKSPPFNYVLRVVDLEYDNWKMVFRATDGNSKNVFDAWTQGKGACATKPETMERSLSCHYRSDSVNQWSNLKVDLVKFALYSQDKEVAYVIFNGRDTDLFTWFDKSRIVSSSWSDVTPAHTFNYVSVVGHRIGYIDRRFFINRKYNGCEKDKGYVIALDTLTVPYKPCKWDTHVVYPQFLYSKINSADIWNDGHYGRAEYMAIFIKTQWAANVK